MAINPDRYQTHIDRPNQQILVASLQDPSKFQANDICKVIPNPKQSDLFFQLPADQWMRSGAQLRAPSTVAPKINYSVGVKRFDCGVYTVGIELDDLTTANFDSPMNPEEDATELLANDMRLRKEIVCKQTLMADNFWQGWQAPNDAPGVFRDYDPSDTYGNGQWDLPNANPAKDVAKMSARLGRKGQRPNFMWMARNVADGLKNNPAIYSRFNGVTPQFLTDEQLASILGVEKIYISDVTYNSAQERQAGQYGYLLNNEVLLGYSEKGPSIYKPSFAYCFTWTGIPGSGGLEAVMKQYRVEERATTTMEAWAAYTYEPVCNDLAVKIVNVLHTP